MTEVRTAPRRLACALMGAALLATQVLPAAATPRFDGLWSVLIVTERGDCDRAYRYPIRIANGALANGGNAAFDIGGKVTSAGAITVSLRRGDRHAKGSGRLAGNLGHGSWSAGSCAGSWEARRQS